MTETVPESLQALAALETTLGPEHPDVAKPLLGWGRLQAARGNHAEADALLRRALTIREAALGPDHPETVESRTAFEQQTKGFR